LREADFDCWRYNACNDPTVIDSGFWSSQALLIALIAFVIFLVLFWAWLQQQEKPKPSLREAVRKIMNDNATAAQNWGDGEAASAFRRAGADIDKEFADRNLS
jgi:hypothetical protein